LKLYNNSEEIHGLLEEVISLLAQHYPGLDTRVPIWSMSGRLTKSLGIAYCSSERKSEEIRFSKVFWPNMSPDQRHEIIIHELCHILVRRVHGPGINHGPEWIEMMKLAAVSPNVSLPVKMPDVHMDCGCENGITLLYENAQRVIKNQKNYQCVVCNQRIRKKRT
jgi:predicted SprT family Zn-dependent metalloprotease